MKTSEKQFSEDEDLFYSQKETELTMTTYMSQTYAVDSHNNRIPTDAWKYTFSLKLLYIDNRYIDQNRE